MASDGWDEAIPVSKVKSLPSADDGWGNAVPVSKLKPKPPEEKSYLQKAGDLVGKSLSAAATLPLQIGEGVGSFARGMVAKPVGEAAGLAAIPASEYARQSGYSDLADTLDPTKVREKTTSAIAGAPPTSGVGKAVAEYNPLALVGKGIEYGADKLTPSPDTLRKLGTDNPYVGAEAQSAGIKEGLMQGAGLLGVKGGPPAVRGAGELADRALPRVDPELRAVAEKAQAYGIPLRPDTLTNSKTARAIGSFLDDVPLGGGKSDVRQEKWNAALGSIIGADTKYGKLNPEVYRKAVDEAGSTINEISEKYPIRATPDFYKRANDTLQKLKYDTDTVSGVTNKFISEISDKIENGRIDGTAFRKIRSDLTARIRRTKDEDMRASLEHVNDFMLDSIKSELNASDEARFDDARYKYSNAMFLEPLVAKGFGNVDPKAFVNKVTRMKEKQVARGYESEIVDLANIAQKFLIDDTPQVPSNSLGTLGKLATIPAAQVYNKLSPPVTNMMMRPPKPKKKATDEETPNP